MPEVTRFAPSPTGWLHLGHALAAGRAAQAAEVAAGGRFLLRMEDIDGPRCRPEYERGIEEDLAWLGLVWEQPVVRQSERMALYAEALEKLRQQGLLYPCFCTRREIEEEVARASGAPQGPDGPLYPGLCRRLSAAERVERIASGEAHAWRLDAASAQRQLPPNLSWRDEGQGEFVADATVFGDVVLARKDIPTSYHLAVVVDDADQGVTLVTRGLDLLPSSHLHRVLQHLLELPTPRYAHHRLVVDEAGQRLAKRDHARALRTLRQEGWTPAQVWREIGL
ncbi:MAG: tRNA glutamyl-Q(34) synthetase GluQRS [Verrucomicrobiales bacterium]|nr:tRNA glutamyl-Q(34) synthetase GluQRS [Verrucomicrobiales bacterium]